MEELAANKVWLKLVIFIFLDTSVFGNPFWFDLKWKHIALLFNVKQIALEN